ncbi:MAG: hypothetical protein GY847_41090 [Proteobacteria bacterium]|nr:hypothetical protein [Pseudomonadota bacterium]
MTNSILYQNSPAELSAGGMNVSYSLVSGGYTGDAIINDNPLFIDSTEGDFRLQPCSPCIDTGDNNALPYDIADLDHDENTTETIPFDLDGKSRNVNSTVDMGAYEYVSP